MNDNAFIKRTMDVQNDFAVVDKVYPTEVMLAVGVTGLLNNSVAMVQQIRTVAHSQLESPIGSLQDTEAREKILTAIRMYFEV